MDEGDTSAIVVAMLKEAVLIANAGGYMRELKWKAAVTDIIVGSMLSELWQRDDSFESA